MVTISSYEARQSADVYNGDDGPAKTEDMGPGITGIVGPLSICNYKD